MRKILLLTALISSAASAQDFDGFYLGAGFGSTNFEDGGLVSDANYALGYQEHLSTDSNGTSVKLIAGYQINRIVAIEAQYTNYGDTDVKLSGTKLGKLEHNSFTVAANLGYTFDNGLRPFGTIGLGSINYKETGTGAAQGWDFDDNGGTIRSGLGIEYAPASFNGFAIRAGYEADFYVMDVALEDYSQFVGSFYIGSTYKF